ncbi:MAG: 16S rRNA (cytosine(1402)-N(4))-methyltransferase RsmH [bacterium]
MVNVTTQMTPIHQPVMVEEVLKFLKVEADNNRGYIVDATVGEGGHTEAILKAGGYVIGLDQDEAVLERARLRLAPYKDRVKLVHGNFRHLKSILTGEGFSGRIRGITADLGVSSYQLEDPRRGFSFQRDGSLDMRMNSRNQLTAADLVNDLKEDELAGIFKKYGEEKAAKRIAKLIVLNRRREGRITSVSRLVELITTVVTFRRRARIHPATRTFQALRIAVNDELEALKEFLNQVPGVLGPGGRVVVISFQSLEDRIVKHTFKDWARQNWAAVLTVKPARPSELEIKNNPRSRSAKLRAVEVRSQ